MAIQKLGEAAVRTLGATQVLVDTASLVKDLVDNALDAHATAVAVEVSVNTIDVIQVRDNGHGIAPEDRSMVAMPNCTSKLHEFDDLRTVGGNSLGFRGQALAAAAEMSGTMTITTRIEGEMVAASLQIDRRGGLIGQDRASAPVGTTVRLTDFMKANPVRRQRAIKDAEKTLKHVKQTCQAYALARPNVRLSLRVLKAKNDKGNFMYAPKQGGSAEDAALKVIGSACVSQCTWSVLEEDGFILQAFVPRPDADPSKVSGLGAFLSVDGRPVSGSRGTFKQIVKMFQNSLKAAHAKVDGIKEPFIYMRMQCPPASYDPNIEPAKDDVLFEDADQVLSVARRLLDQIYPPLSSKDLVAGANQDATRAQNSTSAPGDSGEEFAISLEPPSDIVSVAPMQPWSVADDAVESGRGQSRTSSPPALRSNMYGCDEGDLELYEERPSINRDEVEAEELRRMRRDVKLSNPWVTAKLNASLQPRAVENVAEEMVQPSLFDEMEVQVHNRRGHGIHTSLPTPRRSSPPPPAEAFHPSHHVPNLRMARDGRVIGPNRLPPSQSLPQSAAPVETAAQQPTPSRTLPECDYTLIQSSPHSGGTPLSAIPDATSRRRGPKVKAAADAVKRPFVSPMIDQPPREKVWFDHLQGEGRPRQMPRHPYRSSPADGLVQQGELGDLSDDPRPMTPPRRKRDIRDFLGSVGSIGRGDISELIEGRNFDRPSPDVFISRQSCSPIDQENMEPSVPGPRTLGFVRASEVSDSGFSPDKPQAPPPKRRKTAEGRALRQLSANASGQTQQEQELEGPPLPSSIERRSLMLRRKSSRLPLERIPKERATHNLALNVSVSEPTIRINAASVIDGPRWTQGSLVVYDALPAVTAQDLESLSAGLQRLLRKRAPEAEVVPDLCQVLHEALLANRAEAGSEAGLEVML